MSLTHILEHNLHVFMSGEITEHNDEQTIMDKKQFSDGILLPIIMGTDVGTEYPVRYEVNYTKLWNMGERDIRIACLYHAELDSIYLGAVGQQLHQSEQYAASRQYIYAAMISLRIATNIREMIGTRDLVDLMKIQNEKVKELDTTKVVDVEDAYTPYTQGTMIQ